MTADVTLIANEAKASVSAVCRVLEVPRSTVYARRTRKPSARRLDTKRLDVEIISAFREHKGRYGSPRIHRVLRHERPLGRKRVEARMRALGLRARRPKGFRRTTVADPAKVPAPNLLARRFDWSRPDHAWVGDATYIWTSAGWAYAAILVDLCTRSIVGWAASTACDTELTLHALEHAVSRRRPPPGLLHHTDRGSTYTASDYQVRLRELGMIVSMSRKGDCWDNAVAESTIGTLKAELLAEWIPEDIYDLRRELFKYIELYYNRKRLHSSIAYQSPADYENSITPTKARAA